jgi:hypothetical protein
MNRTKKLLHRSAFFSFMFLALFLIKTNIGFCAAPTLSWSDEEGLWNDGVTPDYGIVSSDDFTFKVIYTDSDNDAPLTGYPKVHILQGGSVIGSYTMTQEVGCGLPYCGNGYTDGEQYYYTTTLAPAGNDYTYYFEAYDSESVKAGFSSPTNEHTLTVVTGYVWVDVSHNGSSTGTEAKPWTTIVDGISNASSGQAVRVMAGSYTGNLTMASGVHVVSDNGSSGDSKTTYNDPYSSYSTSMLTRTGRTEIDGTIEFDNHDVTFDGFSIVFVDLLENKTMFIDGGSPVIKNNIVNRGGTGSCLQMKSNSGFTEPIIENNLFHSASQRGIGVSNNSTPIIQDNEIWDIADYPGIGIHRPGFAGGEITILNNHIFDCDGGIGYTDMSSNTTDQLKIVIQGNTIHDANVSAINRAGIGLKRDSTPGPSLEIIIGGSDPSQGNTIYNCSAGIYLEGNSLGLNPVLVQNNTLYNNDKAGIKLSGVGLSGDIASILDNTIYGHTAQAGISLFGTNYVDIMYNSIYENYYAGINFQYGSGTVVDIMSNSIYENYAGIAFQGGSGTVTVNIEDNDIYSNTMAGIPFINAITGDVTIVGNEIHENYRSGIVIMNSCENLFINRNEIHDNFRSGIHTGGPYDMADDYFANSNNECTESGEPYPCCTGLGAGTCNSSLGFAGTTDSAFLDVSQNKVYGNGLSDIGAGIDIRHASGSIYNNLVYENAMCGIRYGNYIDEISNNTVVDNGIGWLGLGGGIIYDGLDGYVADFSSGDGPSIPIRNNISAFNTKAGIRTGQDKTEYSVCLSGVFRDYNLLFGNNGTDTTVTPITWPPWKICPQLGGCWWNANEIFADPEFVDRGNDDYRIKVTSLAVDTGDAGYDLNTDCTGERLPYPCCTGEGTGTCSFYDYGDDYSTGCSGLPCYGVGATAIDIGAYGGPYGIDW